MLCSHAMSALKEAIWRQKPAMVKMYLIQPDLVGDFDPIRLENQAARRQSFSPFAAIRAKSRHVFRLQARGESEQAPLA
jgi:hypothetical protein